MSLCFQSELVTIPDVAAAVSVLLGFPPSESVSASSASKVWRMHMRGYGYKYKPFDFNLFLLFAVTIFTLYYQLNDILAPSPFSRPRAVLLLEITGGNGCALTFKAPNLTIFLFGIVKLDVFFSVSEHLFQSRFTNSLNRKINLAGSSASIQLPGVSTVKHFYF